MLHLDEPTWRARADAHAARADALTAGTGPPCAPGEPPGRGLPLHLLPHPPGAAARLAPGAGVSLANAAERQGWQHYTPDGSRVDPTTIRPATSRPSAACSRPPPPDRPTSAASGCTSGRWSTAPTRRVHPARPLRLGATGTDVVVEHHRVRCTHYDAYRFFTADRRARSTRRPDPGARPGRAASSRAACTRRWTSTSGRRSWVRSCPASCCWTRSRSPATSASLDMRASPYDLAAHGYTPVRIETAAGKAEYAEAQRGFAARGATLRRRLLETLDDS